MRFRTIGSFWLGTLLVLGGCSDDEGNLSASLTFKGTQNALPNYSFSTGYQPAGSPAQVKLELKSGGGITVEAKGVAAGSSLTGVPGTGKVALAAEILFGVNLKVALGSIKYDGPIKGAPEIKMAFGSTATFAPFLIGKSVSLSAKVPETKVATIPLAQAMGLPGVTGDLELSVAGTLNTVYSGVCAKASGDLAEATGKTVTSGDLTIKGTLKIKALMINKTINIPDIPVKIAAIPANISLGIKSLSGGKVPAKGPCSGGSTTGDGGVTGDGKVPTGDGKVPKGDGKVPTGDGKVPTGDGKVPTGDAAGPGNCNKSSGQPKAAMCKLSSDCKCPSICTKLFTASHGSCWTQCDPAKTDKSTGKNPACSSTGAGEVCWGYGCLPLGSANGSFTDIPVYTYPNTPADFSEFGKASINLDIPQVGKVSFAHGYGTTLVGSPAYSHAFIFYPSTYTGAAPELRIFVFKKSTYKVGSSFDLKKPETAEVRYKEITTDSTGTKTLKVQLRGVVYDGTLLFTKAGSGNKAPASGSLVGRIVHYESEFCGAATTPCK